MPPRQPADSAQKPSVLLAVGPLLQREVDLDGLLDALINRIAGALKADRGTLYLLDPQAGELFSRAAHLPELKQIRLKLGQGVAGHVALTGQLVNLGAAQSDRRFFGEIDRQTGYRTRSMLAAPLRDGEGHIIGVVQVLNASRGSFNSADEEYLKRLCAEAALAVESTSLYGLVRPRGPARLPPKPGPGGAAGALAEERPAAGRRVKAGDRTRRRPIASRATVGEPAAVPVRYRYNRIVGESAAMQAVYALVSKAAATTATVLLRGESGTGKEVIARAIHYNGPRSEGPFVKLDCTTVPATLMENELFGHERGAYTGAQSRAIGKCEQAGGGTLFIDELGELPVGLQAKLLRFLQDREFERVGGTRTLTSDARVVAATHRDLEAMVGRGQFREDLYYRVKVVQVVLPPLRERGAEDITGLALHFLDVFARKHGKGPLELSPAALGRLIEHRWPGNIRELENCIESAVVLCEGSMVGPAHLSLPVGAARTATAEPSEAVAGPATGRWQPRTLDEVAREHVRRTLEAAGGNRSLAAEWLGIGRNTLLRKLRGYGLD